MGLGFYEGEMTESGVFEGIGGRLDENLGVYFGEWVEGREEGMGIKWMKEN